MDTVVGPILGFRGLKDGVWHTSALVIVKARDTPELSWGVGGDRAAGRNDAERTLLKSFGEYEAYRFDWGVEQGDECKTIHYALSDGPEYEYRVPAKGEAPRIAYASCAGFHDPKDMLRVERKKKLIPLIRDRQEKLLQHLSKAEQLDKPLNDPVRIKQLGQISDHLHNILIFLSANKEQPNGEEQPDAALQEAPLLSFLEEIKDPDKLSLENGWELSGRAGIELTRQADDTYLYILLQAELEHADSDGIEWSRESLEAYLKKLLAAYSGGIFGDNGARLEARRFLLQLQRTRYEEYRRDRAKMRIRSNYLRLAGILLSLSLLLLCAFYITASYVTANTANDPSSGYLSILLPLIAVSSGATGSVLSRTYKLSRQPLLASEHTNEGNDPPLGIRQLLSQRIFWVQLVIGATVGLVLFLVFSAGIISVAGNQNVTSDPVTAATVGFLAGFSEPFSLGTLDRVAGQLSAPS